MTNLITHSVCNKEVLQRDSDGYMNATKMCQAAVKQIFDYRRLDTTKPFLKALESKTGIPALELIPTLKSGNQGGTWVHPRVAIHLAQWLSPEFAVQVTQWVFDWMDTGKQPDTKAREQEPEKCLPDGRPEFYKVHHSLLARGMAVIWRNDTFNSITGRPITPAARDLMQTTEAFLQAAKQEGYLIMKPEDMVRKLHA